MDRFNPEPMEGLHEEIGALLFGMYEKAKSTGQFDVVKELQPGR